MKITHICLAAFFIDNYSYQENMLPKYHKKLGYDVSIIASLQSFDKSGKASFLKKGSTYINEYGIPVTRLNYRKGFKRINRKLKTYQSLYKTLELEKPDIIFIHGLQFIDMLVILKYIKNNLHVKLFIDNHCDFSNSATNFISKELLHKGLWRYVAKKIIPYTDKFYGVLPARVDFLIDMYKISKEKVELLVMGADDERVEESKCKNLNEKIRFKYNVKEDDFLIVTGGKIDSAKKQVLLLMQAVKEINNPKIKLLVFGSVTDNLSEKLNSLCDGNIVQYVGWIDSKYSYDYFQSANLVVFPGRHSVFWEQVSGQGIPILVKYWDGTTHVDLGGNCKFLYDDNANEIKRNIEEIFKNKEIYEKMKEVSINKGIDMFSYKKIAKRSIELNEELI